MSETQYALPLKIVAGDSVAFVRELLDYPADEGWTLTYVLLGNGRTPIQFASTAEGSLHTFTLAPEITAAWNPGAYSWTAIATKGTDQRKAIESNAVEILVDPLNPPVGYDPRPWCVRALEAVEAALEGSLEDAVKSFEIRGTKLEALTPDTLRRERVRLVNEVRMLRGGGLVGILGVRLS